MKLPRTYFFGSAVALLLAAQSGQAQQSTGRVFNPVFAPGDPAVLAYEWQAGDRRELYLMDIASGARAPLRLSAEAAPVDPLSFESFDLMGGMGPLASFSGYLDWNPVPSGSRRWFAYVAATAEGRLGLNLGFVDTERSLTEDGLIRLRFDGDVQDPRWSPDGRRLLFVSDSRIYLVRDVRAVIRGAVADIVQVAGEGAAALSPAWSPDGRYVAYQTRPEGGASGAAWGIEVVDVSGEEPAGRVNLTHSLGNTNAYRPSWSPDGSFLAFYSDREGLGPESRSLDIGVVEAQRDPETGRIFRGEVRQGRSRVLAQSVLPNQRRGPTWTLHSNRVGLVYVLQDESQGNPVMLADLGRWLQFEATYALNLSQGADWSSMNHREVVSRLEPRQLRVTYAFAAQDGAGETVTVRNVNAPWLAAMIPAPSRSSVLARSVVLPGWGQSFRGDRGRGRLLMAVGATSMALTAVSAFQAASAASDYKSVPTDQRFNFTTKPQDGGGSVVSLSEDARSRHAAAKTRLMISSGVWATAMLVSALDALAGGKRKDSQATPPAASRPGPLRGFSLAPRAIPDAQGSMSWAVELRLPLGGSRPIR